MTDVCCRHAVSRNSCADLERLELVLSQLSEIEAERDAAVEVSQASSGKVGLLTRLKGIGPEIATMLQKLEAFFRSFGNRREVAAYAGLAPMPWKKRPPGP